jgi:hypothetical protein
MGGKGNSGKIINATERIIITPSIGTGAISMAGNGSLQEGLLYIQ